MMTLHASAMGRGLYSRLGWERGWEMYKELGDVAGSAASGRGRHS